MKKNLVKYIQDSFTILVKNKSLLYAGLIDTLFFMAVIYTTYRINLLTQSSRSLPFYVTGSPPPYLTAMIIAGFIGAFLLAGKLFMIRKVYESHYRAVDGQDTSKPAMGDYMEGMGQFGLKILVGKVFLLIASFIIVFFAVFPVLETEIQVFVGLTPIVFLLVLLLISLWDIIMVAEGKEVKEAIKKSISFVKKNYFAVLLLQMFTGIIALNILSPDAPLRMVLRMRANALGEAVERTLVFVPPLYQGVTNALGTFSWIIVAMLIIILNVIAPMVLMDFYMDRKEAVEG